MKYKNFCRGGIYVNTKEEQSKINKLKEWLQDSEHTVVLTGAGMSTESGIADFRSRDGIWKKINPMELASTSALNNNYEKFYEFYKMRIESLSAHRPHDGYYILADWEKRGLIDSIITQNVDDFHLLAGSKRVYRIHGSINEFRCSRCNHTASKEDFLEKRACVKCKGNLRPGVVLFGGSLPEKDLSIAIEEMKKADLVIVIGTSLTVFPVSQLPDISNGKKVYINREIPSGNSFDLKFEASAGQLLEKIDRAL